MLIILLLLAYFSVVMFILALFQPQWDERPTLEGVAGFEKQQEKHTIFGLMHYIANINKPLLFPALRQRIAKDIAIAHVKITPEEFILMKELFFIAYVFLTYPMLRVDLLVFWGIVGFVVGYMGPEIWLKGKIKEVKSTIIKELPDAIDLLGLCVNAGLDFMLSLKWVVEKSPPSVMVDELNIVMQEINVGKTRRDAIKDLASRYMLPDLSTFARTLVQADKMGTSVTDALNILSEDMRLARYRRGEQLALKAPLKMLVPLLVFIFPVVAVLVAGPIMLDFIENNPFQNVAGGSLR